jgi:hypothetical protein
MIPASIERVWGSDPSDFLRAASSRFCGGSVTPSLLKKLELRIRTERR